MYEKLFSSRNKLKNWLNTSTGIAISTIFLANDVHQLEINTNNTTLLAKVMEERPSEYPDSPYMVRYYHTEGDSELEMDYSRMVMAIAMEATLARNGRTIGGLRPFLKELSKSQYCCTANRVHPAYQIMGLWIVEPAEPAELEELKAVLNRFALAYAFSDGSGFMTLNNFRFNTGGIDIYPDMIKS